MTLQDKKNYLARYRSLKRRIVRDTERLKELRSLAEKITPSINDMTFSNSGYDSDRVQITVEKITSRDKIRTENIIRYINMGERIENAIENIEDDMRRELLELRYLDGETIEKAAELLGQTPRNICRLQNKALSQLKI